MGSMLGASPLGAFDARQGACPRTGSSLLADTKHSQARTHAVLAEALARWQRGDQCVLHSGPHEKSVDGNADEDGIPYLWVLRAFNSNWNVAVPMSYRLSDGLSWAMTPRAQIGMANVATQSIPTTSPQNAVNRPNPL